MTLTGPELAQHLELHEFKLAKLFDKECDRDQFARFSKFVGLVERGGSIRDLFEAEDGQEVLAFCFDVTYRVTSIEIAKRALARDSGDTK